MPKFYNKTRYSASIPAKLLKAGKFYLLPVYYLLLMSELAREGIENSGSYRFADHIYANEPRGNFLVGKWLDLVLLNLKSARSLRSRYIHAKKEIYNRLKSVGHENQIDILAVPCGLARELFEVAREMRTANHPSCGRIRWHGFDLDGELIQILNEKKQNDRGHEMYFWQGDAFQQNAYQENKNYDMIISTGFVDFLNDADALRFYKIVRANMKEGGIFFTSGMRPHALSDYLMRTFAELHTQYRTADMLEALAHGAGFKTVRTYQNELQTILIGMNE